MTPATVYFTALELDPGPLLRDRCINGIIPPEWQRYHFLLDRDVGYPVAKLNRWLTDNIEGRWAIYHSFHNSQRQVMLAFEHDFDAMTFLMADGKTVALRES